MTETLKNSGEETESSANYEQLSDMAGKFDKAQAEQEKAEQQEELAKKQAEEKPFDPDSISPREAIGALYRTQNSGEYKPEKTWDEIRKELEPNPVTRKYKEIKHQRENRKKEKEIENSMSLDYAVKQMKKDQRKNLYKRILNKFR